MDDITNGYISPFSARYASKEMQQVFSDNFKFSTWRKLWVSLAKAEKELGLDITAEQIDELRREIYNIDYEMVEKREKEVRHDVMAHIYAYGKVSPKAAGIIHLGATSCFVGDNTDIIILREATLIIIKKMVQVIKNLSDFAVKYKDLPCLAYTHLQPAQLTTVGKRAALWINELCMDVVEAEHRLNELKLLGSKGTTGTQASFMELFSGDEKKVKKLEKLIAADMGFSECVPVSGQTYSRKTDSFFLNMLSGLAQSAYKFSNDMRILQSFEEMEEPFEKSQIGSSAMPYKRNPMRSERMSALARHIIINSLNPAFTASTQWFERTLDDSANKRISISEAFLAADGILEIYINVSKNLVVYEKVIEKRVMEKLPFMATENILMKSVKKGANRQELHEKLRAYSHEAALDVKLEGKSNTLLEKIANDHNFLLTAEEIGEVLAPNLYTGRSAAQVTEFINGTVTPILQRLYTDDINTELRV
jgi:adenylosuccinate lyase